MIDVPVVLAVPRPWGFPLLLVLRSGNTPLRSAAIARSRLALILPSDREACGDGYWLRVGLKEIRGSWFAASRYIYEPGKARYRWVVGRRRRNSGKSRV